MDKTLLILLAGAYFLLKRDEERKESIPTVDAGLITGGVSPQSDLLLKRGGPRDDNAQPKGGATQERLDAQQEAAKAADESALRLAKTIIGCVPIVGQVVLAIAYAFEQLAKALQKALPVTELEALEPIPDRVWDGTFTGYVTDATGKGHWILSNNEVPLGWTPEGKTFADGTPITLLDRQIRQLLSMMNVRPDRSAFPPDSRDIFLDVTGDAYKLSDGLMYGVKNPVKGAKIFIPGKGIAIL